MFFFFKCPTTLSNECLIYWARVAFWRAVSFHNCKPPPPPPLLSDKICKVLGTFANINHGKLDIACIFFLSVQSLSSIISMFPNSLQWSLLINASRHFHKSLGPAKIVMVCTAVRSTILVKCDIYWQLFNDNFNNRHHCTCKLHISIAC